MAEAMAAERRATTVGVVLVGSLVFLHFLLRPFLYALPVAPNLLVGGLLLGTLRLRSGYAAALGFCLGVLEAAMALEGMGQIALVLTLVGYTAARSRDVLFADARYFTPAYLFIGTWVAHVGLVLGAGQGLDVFVVLVAAPVNALLTAAVCGLAESAAEGLS